VHRSIITYRSVCLSEFKTELEQLQMAREQDAIALSQARDTQRKLDAISQKVIGDIAKLGRAMSTAMAGLGMTLGLMTPETLIEEVERLPGVVRELEVMTAR
jgi:GAF domain-containing protein